MIKTLLFLLILTTNALATQVTVPTVWSINDSVTNVKLNNINNAFANVINGGLDNTNANTTGGYRFFQTVAALPSAGSQGAVYFLSADNTLNFDTGSAFIKSVSTNTTSPAAGDVLYYNGSSWTDLVKGTTGQSLLTGTTPSWGYPIGLNISSQASGDIIYFDGANWVRLAKSATAGNVLQTGTPPSWVNSVSSVSDYGTSTTTSTAKQGTAIKIAYGTTTSLTGPGGTFTVSNLPFTSSSSYVVQTTQVDTGTTGVGYVTNSSGAAFTITNAAVPSGSNVAHTFAWLAIGT